MKKAGEVPKNLHVVEVEINKTNQGSIRSRPRLKEDLIEVRTARSSFISNGGFSHEYGLPFAKDRREKESKKGDRSCQQFQEEDRSIIAKFVILIFNVGEYGTI